MIVSVETTHEASKMKKLYGGQSKETNKPAVQDSLKSAMTEYLKGTAFTGKGVVSGGR